jgi:heme A synthase
MGILVPVLVFMQIGLGAAFRHNAMGVISHIMNAFLVILIALIAGVFVVRQFPDHPALRPAALAMLIVAGVQVLLGFAAYLVLLMSEANNMALIVTSVLHVGNGALTLAASVVLAMEMSRNLIKSSGAR